VVPVDAGLLTRQAALLLESMPIRAVKLGIPGSLANAEAIAGIVLLLRARQPALPVVLDPVLASGHGDPLARGDALAALRRCWRWRRWSRPTCRKRRPSVRFPVRMCW
jgi:hydroxymethylpyrimidine/phosphomethylpyrimidine kinase